MNTPFASFRWYEKSLSTRIFNSTRLCFDTNLIFEVIIATQPGSLCSLCIGTSLTNLLLWELPLNTPQQILILSPTLLLLIGKKWIVLNYIMLLQKQVYQGN